MKIPHARVFDPAQFRKPPALDAKMRHRVQAALEKLIEALDASEDTDTDTQADDQPIDDDEREPSLGSLDRHTSQDMWSAGKSATTYDTDCEAEHDGREPDVDDEEDDPGEDNGDGEPDIGWPKLPRSTQRVTCWMARSARHPVAELDALRAKRRDAKLVAGDCSGSTLRITPPVR